MENAQRYLATDALSQALSDLGLRQDWVASQVGISKPFLSRVLKGTRTVDHEIAQRLSALLRVPFFVAWKLPISSKTLLEESAEVAIA